MNGCCFRACCTAPIIGSTAGDIAIPLAVAALALTAGLTVVAFVKAVGIGFLGRPRSHGGRRRHRSPGTMRAGRRVCWWRCASFSGVAPTLILPPSSEP